MKKKFKSKKHIKIKYKNIIIFIIIILTILLLLKTLSKQKIIQITPLETIKYSNRYNKINLEKKIKRITSKLTKIDINKPTTILKNMIQYKEPNKKNYYYAIKNPKENKEPLVYIYNTHQTEEYIDNETVYTESIYLKQKLEENDITTILEEANIKDILEENNWNYTQSYKASRINLEKIKEHYPSIKIFIDLHRDSVKKQYSTTTIDNKDYAKVLFVIGKEHKNYEKNLEFTTQLNTFIEQNYPTLTKGILQKEGPGVNGIYNQDIAPNIILMEVGGYENTKEEVENTLGIITNIIKEKINEN